MLDREAPGLAILLVVMAFNMVGDGLRDAFEVRPAAAPLAEMSGTPR
jgi:hypothetical protein